MYYDTPTMGHISSETAKINRGVLFKIFGTVQGVGFRPEIYRQATSFGLCGYVKNCGDFVELYLEGDQQRLKRFIEKFESSSLFATQNFEGRIIPYT